MRSDTARSSLSARLGAIAGAAALGLTALLSVAPAQPAEAAAAPNPFVTSTLTKVYDGTGFVDGKPSPASSFINGENGFFPGDNGPDDGYVTSSDTVGYLWETKVAAGPARTVEVRLELPEYLSFDRSLNGSPCISLAGIKGAYNNNAASPGCTYEVKAGQSFSAGVALTLTAKDTAGTVQADQTLKTVNAVGKGGLAYSSDSAEPVTVLSAPSADLLIRPATCAVGGSCRSLQSTTTSSSFIIFPEPIKWNNYDSLKGATAATPWTAQVDVSGMPAGTTYSVGGVAYVPDANGLIQLPESVGPVSLNYVAPENWGGEEFQEGENRDFTVHLIVPDTAFATADYKNNGDGWEPGQGEGSAFPTKNDRDSGAKPGYYYPNNDWTMVKVYKPIPPPTPEPGKPAPMLSKTISRPWASNQTLWESGNTTFTSNGGVVEFRSGISKYRDVTEGTQVRSNLNFFPANSEEDATGATIVLMDTWNPAELQADGDPYLLGPDGNPLQGYPYKIQWSPTVVGDAGLDGSNNSGWFDTRVSTADPSKVKSVRVVIEGLPLGSGALSNITFVTPQVVVDPYAKPNPNPFSDTMRSSIDGEPNPSYNNNVIPVTKPVPGVGLTGSNSPEVLDRQTGTIDYVYSPTATGLTSTTDPITGEVTFTVDPCITDIDLTGSGWEMVGDFVPGTGCMGDDPQPGSFKVKPAGDGWIPGNNYTPNYSGPNKGCVAGRDCAILPDIKFSATTNPMVVGDIVVTGVWDMTSPEGAEPSNPVSTTTNAEDYDLTAPTLETSTPKVEVGDTLKFTASVTAKHLGDVSREAEAILILPGRGNDAGYLQALEDMNPDDPYGDNGEPLNSNFSGTYLMTKLQLDPETSVPGATLLCTSVANPSMDPADYNASDWSTDCTDSADNPITAVKIIQPEGKQPAGVHLDIELTPTGNEVGDNYLMWLGPIYVEGAPKSMVWPVNDEVVASTISGYTYWDASGMGMPRTDTSRPVPEMTVELLNAAGDVIATTAVNEDGYYEFADLHSGTYFTRVPAIGQPGGAPATVDSYYYPGRQIPVEQTFSYLNGRGDLATTQSTAITLGMDATVSKVNFGYFAPDPYSDLLKDPAKVTCVGDEVTCTVEWEITVKNGGSSFDPSEILGIVGSSGANSGVWTSDGYYLVKADGTATLVEDIGGTVLGATGNNPSSANGSAVWTTDGYYIVKSGSATKVEGIDGTVLGATGISPATNGSAVWTSEGYYLVKADGTVTKAEGIDGTVLGVTGISPVTSSGSGSGVWTSEGYYLVKGNGTVTKVSGLGGTVLGATGNSPAGSSSGVWTTDGYYVVTSAGTVTKAQGLGGTVLGATGYSPGASYGSGVWTTDGYYLVRLRSGVLTTTKVQGLSGAVLGATGDAPENRNYGNGSGVWTTDGYYLLRAAASTATKVQGIDGEILGTVGTKPTPTGTGTSGRTGSGVWTSDSYYVVSADGVATKAGPISGEVLGVIGDGPATGTSGVWTSEGYYIVDRNGVAIKASIPLYEAPDNAGPGITLTGGRLTDSTSGAVFDVEVATGERVTKLVGRGTAGGYAQSTDGTVYSWGSGQYGANGNDGTTNNTTALPVQGLPDNVTEIINRGSGTSGTGGYALTADGKVYSWGSGQYGANGNGSTDNNLTAELVQGLDGKTVTEVVDRDGEGAYAITTDGEVYAWGRGDTGRTANANNPTPGGANGNGSKANNLVAAPVQGLPGGVVQVVARKSIGGIALTKDGEVYSWGYGTNAANGNGSSRDNLTALVVQGLDGVAVADVVARNGTQPYGGYGLTADGRVFAWGRGYNGGNGNGRSGSGEDNYAAEPVLGLPAGISKVVARDYTAGYALTLDGKVYAWGAGTNGANGNDSTTNNLIAQPVQGLDGLGVVDIVARGDRGASGAYALTSDGQVYSWGVGTSGSNGNGSTGTNLTAQPVQGLPTNVSQLIDRAGAGGYALTTDGKVYAWGQGQYGANGDGGTANNLTAELVQGLPTNLAEVVARGANGGYALTTDGRVFSWGQGASGQNGNGGTADNLVAAEVSGLDFNRVIMTPLSETPNGEFITRDYKLSNLAPGEEVTIYLSGKVNRPSYEKDDEAGKDEGVGLVIGNQAWESFNETPRNAPDLPKPALPAYDKTEGQEFKYGQWGGNNTCTATPTWVTPGDQCGQVWAQVPPTKQLLGSLAGYVFWDQDRDGTQVPGDPMVVGVKVTLYKGENGTFTEKAGETITDDNGHYLFKNLVPGDDYYVAFSPAANPKVSTDGGDTTEDMLKPGQSWVYTVQYPDAPFYAENKSASNADGYTHNVSVVANATTEPVNAGLAVYEAAIAVLKGTLVEGEEGPELKHSVVAELDDASPGFTKPIAVTSISTNTGDEPLANLVFTDTNVSGPKVAWQSCAIDDPASTTDVSGGTWDDDTFTFTFPETTTLAVGGKLTCTGTLPAISTEDFPPGDAPLHEDEVNVAAEGTITDTPVEGDSPFEVTPVELPTPAITLEKGAAIPAPGAPEGTDCSATANAKNPALCSIESGTEANPVLLKASVVQKVTFRITNTGPESLLDPTLEDVTTVGEANVADMSCAWPTKTVNGKTRNFLGTTSPNNVAICTGNLTIAGAGVSHQNQAEIFAVGEVSKKLTTDEAEFNAATQPKVTLPLSGGQTAALFAGLAALVAAVSAYLFVRSRKQQGGRAQE